MLIIKPRSATISELLKRLAASVPDELVHDTKKPGGTVKTMNLWQVKDLLDARVPGWEESVEMLALPTGDVVFSVTITIHGSDGSLSRVGVGLGDEEDTSNSKQPGDQVVNGYATAFKRAAAGLGLARVLWLSKVKTRGWIGMEKGNEE